MALKLARNQKGQAVTEYILLLAIVVASFVTVMQWVTRFGLAQKLTKPITTDFANAYQLGDVKAESFENGGSGKRHPRLNGAEDSFRIFINPKFQ